MPSNLFIFESFLETKRFRQHDIVQKCLRALETVTGISMGVHDCNRGVNIIKKREKTMFFWIGERLFLGVLKEDCFLFLKIIFWAINTFTILFILEGIFSGCFK